MRPCTPPFTLSTTPLRLSSPLLRRSVHAEAVASIYGKRLLLLSLLDEKGDEAELAAALAACVAIVRAQADTAANAAAVDAATAADTTPRLHLYSFDFHARCKASARSEGVRDLLQSLQSLPDDWRPSSHGYFAAMGGSDTPSRTQQGLVRTNCLDCLNRTNMAQTVIALDSADEQVCSHGPHRERLANMAPATDRTSEPHQHMTLRRVSWGGLEQSWSGLGWSDAMRCVVSR